MTLKDNKGQDITEATARGSIWFSSSEQKTYVLAWINNSRRTEGEWHFIDLSGNIGIGNPGWGHFITLESHLESYKKTMYCIGHVKDLDIESFVAEQQC